jgi:rhamnulokinase
VTSTPTQADRVQPLELAAHVSAGLPARAARLLLIPDLCHHLLCGSVVGELTNAPTTQLLNVRSADWDDDLFERLGLPRALMPELVPAGSDIGRLRRGLVALDLPSVRVVAPATHDTASAVLGTPLEDGWAYISSGTWLLVGVERDAPRSMRRSSKPTSPTSVAPVARFGSSRT